MRSNEIIPLRQFGRTILNSVLTVGIMLTAMAFGENTESSGGMDIDARRASVVNLEQHIGQRQQRLDELLEDIKTLDGRLEKRVDQVIGMVGKVKDSDQSKVRVAQIKANVITTLRKMIEYYKGKRDAIHEQLRQANPKIPREILERTLGVFDARIETRIEQVLELTKTFTEPKELAKYETTSSGYWGGWGWSNEAISEDWKQNRRESRHTEAAAESVVDKLRKSIDYLDQRDAWFAEKLKGTNLTDIERELYQSDMDRNANLILVRKEQLEDFLTTGTPEAKPLQRNAAHDLELLIRDTGADLREDFFTIFRKYSELNKERADLNKLTINLEARKKWLIDYDAKNAK